MMRCDMTRRRPAGRYRSGSTRRYRYTVCLVVNLRFYAELNDFLAADRSLIRELMHPATHGNRRQSLAEATVAAGATTLLHRHLLSEEIYHVTAGEGEMVLGAESFAIGPGDTICIAPRTPHRVSASSSGPLVLLCCCSPAYAHEDTELL